MECSAGHRLAVSCGLAFRSGHFQARDLQARERLSNRALSNKPRGSAERIFIAIFRFYRQEAVLVAVLRAQEEEF